MTAILLALAISIIIPAGAVVGAMITASLPGADLRLAASRFAALRSKRWPSKAADRPPARAPHPPVQLEQVAVSLDLDSEPTGQWHRPWRAHSGVVCVTRVVLAKDAAQ